MIPADNDVLNGIRCVASLMQAGLVTIHESCTASRREFGLYSWDDKAKEDRVVKENDHAMDDIRYFVSTVLGAGESFACAVQRETGKGVSIWDF